MHVENKGQAMAEFCVSVPVMVLLLWAVLYLSDMYVVKYKTLTASRYGTWLLSRYDNLPKHIVTIDDVKKLIAERFFNSSSEGLAVNEQHAGNDDNSDLTDKVREETDSGDEVDAIISALDSFIGSDSPAMYSLKVIHDYPKLFGPLDLRDGNGDSFKIQSEHFVIGNSWDGGRVEGHDIISMLGEMFGPLLDEIKNPPFP